MMGVPEAEAEAESCRRFAAAIANGKLSPAQLTELANGEPSTETQAALLQAIVAPGG